MGKRKHWEDWGTRFRLECRHKEITTRQVADRIGLAESSVRSWINGTREINLSDFFRLCSAAGIDPASILFTGQADPDFAIVSSAWAKSDERGRELLRAAAEAAERLSETPAKTGLHPGSPRRGRV